VAQIAEIERLIRKPHCPPTVGLGEAGARAARAAAWNGEQRLRLRHGPLECGHEWTACARVELILFLL
jgi:hypothetical protein